MTYRLSPESLRAGIAHLSRYGDTDIFPHLPELSVCHEINARFGRWASGEMV
jgi:hypothetical protein